MTVSAGWPAAAPPLYSIFSLAVDGHGGASEIIQCLYRYLSRNPNCTEDKARYRALKDPSSPAPFEVNKAAPSITKSKMTTLSGPNSVFTLAADNPSRVLQLLQADSSIASAQDEHGYSLVHAAASYGHLELLRTLVNTYHVDVDLKDEDGETPLFGVETVEVAKVLIEELHADIKVIGSEGKNARERITDDNDFPEVAVYLRVKELEGQTNGGTTDVAITNGTQPPPPLPEGMSVDFGTMAPEDAGAVVDPEFRRRIEELAAREDFEGEEGQEALRNLVTEALRGEVGQEREVRQRTS